MVTSYCKAAAFAVISSAIYSCSCKTMPHVRRYRRIAVGCFSKAGAVILTAMPIAGDAIADASSLRAKQALETCGLRTLCRRHR
jgi:hypothetical protein